MPAVTFKEVAARLERTGVNWQDKTGEEAEGKESYSSSETQGQLVGARESLNRRKNMARRKVVAENFCFSAQSEVRMAAVAFGTGLVRHCPQGLFSLFFTFLCAIFFRPFRLSLAPTICPWVSEDESHSLFPNLNE